MVEWEGMGGWEWVGGKFMTGPGLEVAPCGILICKDGGGRPSGEAYCEFGSPEVVDLAMGKNNNNMGHR